ncbi:MAG: hypothetical protein JWP11_2416 [Frankiales bacterium]|nr:hypothetical protein [Frankiales bacterium]
MASGTRQAGTTTKPRRKVLGSRLACGECGARLSAYNPGPNCFAHTLDLPWKGPGVRPR